MFLPRIDEKEVKVVGRCEHRKDSLGVSGAACYLARMGFDLLGAWPRKLGTVGAGFRQVEVKKVEDKKKRFVLKQNQILVVLLCYIVAAACFEGTGRIDDELRYFEKPWDVGRPKGDSLVVVKRVAALKKRSCWNRLIQLSHFQNLSKRMKTRKRKRKEERIFLRRGALSADQRKHPGAESAGWRSGEAKKLRWTEKEMNNWKERDWRKKMTWRACLDGDIQEHRRH